jgi:hypothetical protein
MRDILTAFAPEFCGWVNNKPAYYRKRLLHRGYQLLVKECKDDASLLDQISDNYMTDDCWFMLVREFGSKRELLDYVIMK